MERRTYNRQRNQTPTDGETPVAPPPAPSGGGWLKTGATIAIGAIIGGVAWELFKKHVMRNKSDDDGDDYAQPMSPLALPGAQSIMPMPMPMPMPFPMPMPMPSYGYGPPQPQQSFGGMPEPKDDRPLTKKEELELARIKNETLKTQRDLERMRQWEEGEVD